MQLVRVKQMLDRKEIWCSKIVILKPSLVVKGLTKGIDSNILRFIVLFQTIEL